MKTCNTCGTLKEDERFYYHHARCKDCSREAGYKWRNANPEKVAIARRRQNLKKKYGISIKEYDEMLKNQMGLCRLCNNTHERRSLNVDHCHLTGKIRGLLCDKCNLAIGLFDDNPALLFKTIQYLKGEQH